MTSIQDIQTASDKVIRIADNFVNRKATEEEFNNSVDELYNLVRAIKSGVEVGATADKLFRQSNLLKSSSRELVAAVEGGGSIEPFYTRVKNGTNNVTKTAQQLVEEGGI